MANHLSDDDIDQMVKDAESHAEEDRQRRKQLKSVNNADALVYQIEKLCQTKQIKYPMKKKAEVEGALAGLKEALENENEDIEAPAASEHPTTVSQAFSQLYESAAQQAGDASPDQSEDAEDVVDAEIVDEDQ